MTLCSEDEANPYLSTEASTISSPFVMDLLRRYVYYCTDVVIIIRGPALAPKKAWAMEDMLHYLDVKDYFGPQIDYNTCYQALKRLSKF